MGQGHLMRRIKDHQFQKRGGLTRKDRIEIEIEQNEAYQMSNFVRTIDKL